jgi:hypothetical protein
MRGRYAGSSIEQLWQAYTGDDAIPTLKKADRPRNASETSQPTTQSKS